MQQPNCLFNQIKTPEIGPTTLIGVGLSLTQHSGVEYCLWKNLKILVTKIVFSANKINLVIKVWQNNKIVHFPANIKLW